MAKDHTLKEIADAIGYSISYVWDYCDKNHIETKKKLTVYQRLKTKDTLIRKMAKDKTRQEIADELGVNVKQITAYCKKEKIEMARSNTVTIEDYDPIIRKLAPTSTVEEIAEEIGYSTASVYIYCNEHNISRWKAPTIRDKKSEIIELAKTKTLEEIAEIIGYSYTNTSTFMKQEKIKAVKRAHGNNKERHTFERVEIEDEKNILFIDYYNNWVNRFKKGVVQPSTFERYVNTYNHLQRIIPDTKLKDMTRDTYQRVLNEYAVDHAEASVKGFHRAIRKSLVDAFYEGILKKDPTYNIVTKGYEMEENKKFYNEKEISKLFDALELEEEINEDYLIYLLIKTGFRYAEAMALTVGDFDFKNKQISVNKTLIYKKLEGANIGQFAPTKNESSNRTIQIDNETNKLFKNITKDMESSDLVFGKVSRHNSTTNQRLKRLAKKANINDGITIHGLRHSHASILISNGAPILSVSERLGHSKPETTQNVYIHRTKELERKDKAKIRKILVEFKAGENNW